MVLLGSWVEVIGGEVIGGEVIGGEVNLVRPIVLL